MKYFAPLSSFKPKHKRLSETIDFIKIGDMAVINLNNMLPVSSNNYIVLDLNSPKSISDVKRYNLLKKHLVK